MRRVAFFGGNGHCQARLAPAQPFWRAVELTAAAYPGFEGRPRVGSLDQFLAAVEPQCRSSELVFATGIGGLLALCLRSRGQLEMPLVLHAPVLWGLERRRMPTLMRRLGLRHFLPAVFGTRWFQRRFVRKQFRRPLDPAMERAFFAGYAQCAAFKDLFAWLAPPLLRELERRFAARPEGLADVEVWWGGDDRVVTPAELEPTRAALGVAWPLTVFETWGHYPMLEEPEAWVAAVEARAAEL